MSETTFVTAELKMNADKPRQQVIEAIEQFCLDMQSEAGCLQANATYDSKDPLRVILWERYENRAAISAFCYAAYTSVYCG